MSDSPKIQTDEILISSQQNNMPFSMTANHIPTPVNTGDLQVIRGENGKFVGGISPNPKGRPKGTRNKLTETFMRMLAEDFQTHGMDAFSQLRATNVEAYLRIIISILPKSLIKEWEESPNVDYDEITEEQFMQLLNDLQRRKLMQKAVETVSK